MHILICLHFSCILHVEPVAQDYVAEEAEASEVEVQEELQALEAAEQVEEQEFDLTNPDQQPGKHRKHLTSVIYIYLSFSLTLCYLLVH